MKIAILGAGGVGGYFGATMARAGHDVRLFARGDHLAAIRSRGLEVREPGGTWRISMQASADPADLAGSDFAVVAVKSYSLGQIAPVVRRAAEAGAVVLPLLNGVEAFDTLAAAGVPADGMLEGLAMIGATRPEPGVVHRASEFRAVVLGERSGGPSGRAERIASAFRDGGADARVSEDVTVDLWRKFLFLATFAAVSGMSRRSIGAVREAPLGRRLLERGVGEIAAVARARGVALPEGEEGRALERFEALAPDLKPSLLFDLERGSPTELDVLSGAVSRYGAALGIPTPVHDTATAVLSAASANPAAHRAETVPAAAASNRA
jgi:2-dehydropantoate 2-reductase